MKFSTIYLHILCTIHIFINLKKLEIQPLKNVLRIMGNFSFLRQDNGDGYIEI